MMIETSPTGYTLLLLYAAKAYHREELRNQSSIPDEVKLLFPRLHNSDFTRIVIVTLPEATPVQEALNLQVDLNRAEILPFA